MIRRYTLFIISVILLTFFSCDQDVPSGYRDKNIDEYNTRKLTKNLLPQTFFTRKIDESVLDRLNYYREGLGLPKVNLNITLSKGANLHNEYMMKNNLVTHFQDPKNPAYNLFGAETAMSSVLAGNVKNGTEAIDLWMNSLYHRQYLLSPSLEDIGFSYGKGYATMYLGDLGLGVSSSLEKDLDRQISDSLKSKTEPIAYPFDGQKDVPIDFDIIESPNPIPDYLSLPTGPFITLTFDKTEMISKIIRAEVSTEQGKEISISRFLAKNKNYVLAILPEKPLPYNEKIIVEVELEIKLNIDNEELLDNAYTYKKVWSFTTISKS